MTSIADRVAGRVREVARRLGAPRPAAGSSRPPKLTEPAAPAVPAVPAVPAAPAAPAASPPVPDRAQAEEAERRTTALLESETEATADDPRATTPGPPFSRRSPYLIGLLGSLGIFTGWALILTLERLTDVVSLVVIALFLALGLEPAVARLSRRGLGRGWAVLVVVLLVAALIAAFVWIVVPPIVTQANQLIQHTPSYLESLQDSRWFKDADGRWHISDAVIKEIKAHANQSTVLAILGGVLGLTARIVDSVTRAVTAIILTILFLATLPQIKTAAYSLVPASRRSRFVYLSEEILSRVGAYILGQVCVAVINGLFCYVLLIVLGLPFPVILSITVGLLALVPIVGTLVGGTLVTAVAATQGVTTATFALGYFVLYHLLETYVIAPRIMRRAVEVPPLVTIVAVLAGSAVAGVLGALMAIPVVAGILLLCRHVLVPRQQRR